MERSTLEGPKKPGDGVELALALADLHANWGEYEDALRYLHAVGGDAVGRTASFKRRRWTELAQAKTSQ
jgi:hypothetical protein